LFVPQLLRRDLGLLSRVRVFVLRFDKPLCIRKISPSPKKPGDLGAVAVAVDGNVGLDRDRLRCPIWFIGS
jgi:hypothetical protein